MMRKGWMLLVLVSAVARADAFDDWKTKIDRALAPQLAGRAQVGVAIGVIDHGRRAVWTYGEASPGTAPTARTLFEIGSLTKTFTGLALGKLAARGTVSLDDKVGKHVSELAGSSAGELTLRQLSTHTSGLPRIFDDLVGPPFDPADPFRQYSAERAFAWLHAHTVTPFPSFDAKQYSNSAVALLGVALTRAAHATSFESFLHDEVLTPLALGDTAITLTPDQLKRFATPHDDTAAAVSAWHFTDFWQAAGALHASAEQMLDYLAANLQPENTPLAAAFALQHEVQAHGTTEDIGLGWILDSDRLWHTGETGGFLTLVEMHPSLARGVVVLSNIALPAQCVAETIFDRPCQVGLGITLDADQRRERAGTYLFPGDVRLVVSDNGAFLVGELRSGERSLGHFRMWGNSASDFFDAQHTLSIHYEPPNDRIRLSVAGQSAVGTKQRGHT